MHSFSSEKGDVFELPSLQNLDLVIQSYDIHPNNSQFFFSNTSHLCLPQNGIPFRCKADGCTRVGIHPMAFLGRTARLREFKFQDNLQVGEHEQLLGCTDVEMGEAPSSWFGFLRHEVFR